jgi:stage IV sporulation protein A
MQSYNLYKDISERTGGDIYIGVVGPVRTGKSTFIKRFMDMLVLPNLDDTHEKERVVDELPQSSAGKTIMTTQPKFVPNEAVKIRINDEAEMKVRMVDSVGYMVDGAMGHLENNVPRMVTTPWFDHDIPFEEAARRTRKSSRITARSHRDTTDAAQKFRAQAIIQRRRGTNSPLELQRHY